MGFSSYFDRSDQKVVDTRQYDFIEFSGCSALFALCYRYL